MSGLGEKIGEVIDVLAQGLKDLEGVDALLKSARGGGEVMLPRGIESRDALIESLIGDRLDALEKIAKATAGLVLIPFLDPDQGDDEEPDMPEGIVVALMEAVALVRSRSTAPGQDYFGYRLEWVEASSPTVDSAPDPGPTLHDAFAALVSRYGITMGQFHVRGGTVVRNTLRPV